MTNTNSTWTIIFIVGLLTLISVLSLELGITTTSITPPDTIENPGVIGIFSYVFNAMGSFLQLLTFQSDLPSLINTLIIMPISFGVFYIIIVVIRGGGA